MKIANFAVLKVFCKEQEDENAIRSSLIDFFPFKLEDEKILVETQTALGFNDSKIQIISVNLSKERHLNAFLRSLHDKLTITQRELLCSQIATRIDDELHFFIRFDKDALLKNKELLITDSGNCFHLTITIAAYPKKIDVAQKIVKSFLLA